MRGAARWQVPFGAVIGVAWLVLAFGGSVLALPV